MAHIAETIVQPVTKAFCDFGDQVGRISSPLRRQAREATLNYLDEQKERAAQEVSALADIMRRSAQSGDHEANSMVAGYAVDIAGQIEGFAGTLRERRSADILADAEGLARRQPALFLLGAVAIGFVIGFMLTSAEETRPHNGEWHANGRG
jgi:hypothetical protein